jgi:hypothetical protein
MHRHLREHALRLVHVVIFAALVLRSWCNCTCSAVHETTISIAQRLRLARSPPSQQPRPQRGKQPRPPRTVAVVLADSCSSIKPLDRLAAVLTWCDATHMWAGVSVCSVKRSTQRSPVDACRCLRRDIQALLVYHPQGATCYSSALCAALIKTCVHLLDTVFPR